MNQFAYKPFYRRNLPHIQPEGATFFVTFRLDGSLPTEVAELLQQERQQIQDLASVKSDFKKYSETKFWQKFEKWDSYLDMVNAGPKYLSDERVADLLAESFHYRDRKVYDLHAFCIMSNHAHIVFAPLEKGNAYISLSEIMHSLKRHTARQANLILGRNGSFWQHESYDHFVRDDKDFERIVTYVIQNPVKANLVENWQDWKWTFCKYEV
jgi:REP element-mobilizing transposase RayT